jgi:hypothetical protein
MESDQKVMVLEKAHDRIARWGTDTWVIEDRARYRWCDIENRPITDWFDQFELALQFAIESGTQLGATGTRNQT